MPRPTKPKSIGPYVCTALGVDPGLQHTGWALVDVHLHGEALKSGGVILTPVGTKGAGRVSMAEDHLSRSTAIYRELRRLLGDAGAEFVCVEGLSLGMPNVQTMVQQGMAVAVVGAAAAESKVRIDSIGPNDVRRLIGVVELPRTPRGQRAKLCACGRKFGADEKKCAECKAKRPSGPAKPKKDPDKPEVRAVLERRWGDLSGLVEGVVEGRRVHVRDAAAVVAAALEDPSSNLRQHVKQVGAALEETEPRDGQPGPSASQRAAASPFAARLSRAASRMVVPNAYGSEDA